MMDKFIEVIVSLCLVIAICVLFAVVAYGVYDFKEKRLFYNECITTDYDKFQCYAMIYGDK